jgi:Fe-S cluster assembly ATP-binding protein
MIYNKRFGKNLSPVKFREILKEKMALLDIDENFMGRYLNEGFSGGEKKRMEILQMLVLAPKLAILDETDSGLDIDAIWIVSKAVNKAKKEFDMTILLITHYSRILKYVEPDSVYIMRDGKIVESGGKELAHELEEKGYAPFGE